MKESMSKEHALTSRVEKLEQQMDGLLPLVNQLVIGIGGTGQTLGPHGEGYQRMRSPLGPRRPGGLWRRTTTMSKHYTEFKAAYERLAEDGQCDTFGGHESQVVYVEWLESDRSVDLANLDAFIVERANHPDRFKPSDTWE
jgi:hypothetical protein